MLEIKQLYDNELLNLDAIRERMKNKVGWITSEQYVVAEQLLMDENPDECRNEDVCTMLDVLDVLFETDEHSLPFAHTIDAYCSEVIL